DAIIRRRVPASTGQPAVHPVGELQEDLADDPGARQQGLAMLADPSARQKFLAESECRIRLRADLTQGPGMTGGPPFLLARQGIARQALIDEETPPMRRSWDLISMILGEPEGRFVRRPRRIDLVLAIGPLHEDHPAADFEASGHAGESLRDRGDGTADYAA